MTYSSFYLIVNHIKEADLFTPYHKDLYDELKEWLVKLENYSKVVNMNNGIRGWLNQALRL